MMSCFCMLSLCPRFGFWHSCVSQPQVVAFLFWPQNQICFEQLPRVGLYFTLHHLKKKLFWCFFYGIRPPTHQGGWGTNRCLVKLFSSYCQNPKCWCWCFLYIVYSLFNFVHVLSMYIVYSCSFYQCTLFTLYLILFMFSMHIVYSLVLVLSIYIVYSCSCFITVRCLLFNHEGQRRGKGQFCRRSDNHHNIYSVKFW